MLTNHALVRLKRRRVSSSKGCGNLSLSGLDAAD